MKCTINFNPSTQVHIRRINRKQNGKVYTSIILTRSHRDNGKQKRETLAVLTKWPKHLITALEAALKNKTATDFKSFEFEQDKSYGVLHVMNEICKRLGIIEALNRTSYGRITLLQIMARILNNGSQRAIGNWAGLNAVGSNTAPDIMCTPISDPFSTKAFCQSMPYSFEICTSFIAADKPDGSLPTMTTSNSIDSLVTTLLFSISKSVIIPFNSTY